MRLDNEIPTSFSMCSSTGGCPKLKWQQCPSLALPHPLVWSLVAGVGGGVGGDVTEWRGEGKDRGRMPGPPAQHFLPPHHPRKELPGGSRTILGHRSEMTDRKDVNLGGRMTEE